MRSPVDRKLIKRMESYPSLSTVSGLLRLHLYLAVVNCPGDKVTIVSSWAPLGYATLSIGAPADR